MALYSPGGLNLADTTAPLILAYDDTGATDVVFAVSSSGDLTITPDGGDVNVAGAGNVGFTVKSSDDNAQLNISADTGNTATSGNQDPVLAFWSANTRRAEVRYDESAAELSFGVGGSGQEDNLIITATGEARFQFAGTPFIQVRDLDTTITAADVLIGGFQVYGSDASGTGAGVKGGLEVYSNDTNGTNYYTIITTGGTAAGGNNVEVVRFGSDLIATFAGQIIVGGAGAASSNNLSFADTGGIEWDIVYNNNGLEFQEAGAGSNRLFLADGGFVGVNIGTPAMWLQVDGDLTSNGTEDVALFRAGDGLNGGTLELSIDHGDGATTRGVRLQSIDGQAQVAPLILNPAGGAVFIREVLNGKLTIGLTINQLGNDDEIFALKSSDVGHPMTDIAEADTFFSIKKVEGVAGGVSLQGYKDSGGNAGGVIELWGILGEAADTVKSTSSRGVIEARAAITNGAAASTTVGSNGNLFVIRNNGTARFAFDAEGDSHQDVGTAWTNFDDVDDALMLRSLGIVMDPASAIRTAWDDWGRDHYEDIIEVGLIPRLSKAELARGDRPLVNMTQHARILNGAVWQHDVAIKDGAVRQGELEACLFDLVTANPNLEGRDAALALLEA